MAFETSHTEVEARLLERVLAPGACVLEIGCGRRTRLASRRDRIAQLVGVDLDAAAGTENASLDRFVAADLCQPLPFGNASFDVVYANFVVEHLSEPETTFRECRRLLRAHGALILITSNLASPPLAISRLVPHRLRTAIKRVGAGVVERDVIPVRYRANTPWRLDSLLHGAGFARVEIVYVATLHRYAERKATLSRLLRLLERCLPPYLRSTIVAWYRPH
jgi:SAM-dependent methyltransferase